VKALVNADILDCTGADPIRKGVLLVDGRRIAAVGPRDRTNVPPDAEVIDLAGATLMAGMINTHDHLGHGDPYDPLLDYPAYKKTRLQPGLVTAAHRHTFAVKYGRQELKDGVTTIRIAGERDFGDLYYKEAFDRGMLPGPRIIPSGPSLCTEISHGKVCSVVVNGVDQVRAQVRTNIAAGAQTIKLFISGGRTLGVPYHLTTSFFTREEIHAAIEEAHKFDAKVIAHLNGGIGVDWGLEAGLDSVEHGFELSDHELELVVKNRVPVSLSLLWHFTPSYRANLGDQSENVKNTVRRLYDAGVRLTVGNDACHGEHGLAKQLEHLVRFGIPPMDAIHTATKTAAAACGLEDSRGTLEVGKDADVIAVGGDPLADISCIQDIRMVMKEGRIYEGL
jgi:imidazolonepropionase-like amidohydrolase